MYESLEVKFHLQRAVPVLKCEHRPPVQPECRIKYLIVEYILYRLVIQILVPCHEELHDFHTALLAQIEFAICVGILASVHCCSAQ